MTIEIRSRDTKILFACEIPDGTEQPKREALVQAVASGADLRGADLTRAYLSGADLTRANLSGADLRGANLTRADLSDANLRDADLRCANLTRANLSGADLRVANLRVANLSDANLTRADLTGADLSGADLRGANLRDAYLSGVRESVWETLDEAPHEVPALLAALHEGRVDGSQYNGECSCLVGTLQSAVPIGCDLSIKQDSQRPSERWFMGIAQGHTPASNPFAEHAMRWVLEWAEERYGSELRRAYESGLR